MKLAGVVSFGLLATAIGLSSRPPLAYGQATQRDKALDEISRYADHACQSVPIEQTGSGTELNAEGKARLRGLISFIAGLGISLSAEHSTNQSRGVLQKDLATAINDHNTCELSALKILLPYFLPTGTSLNSQIEPTPISLSTPVSLPSTGSSTEADVNTAMQFARDANDAEARVEAAWNDGRYDFAAVSQAVADASSAANRAEAIADQLANGDDRTAQSKAEQDAADAKAAADRAKAIEDAMRIRAQHSSQSAVVPQPNDETAAETETQGASVPEGHSIPSSVPDQIVLRGVHFDSGSTSLREVDKPVLDLTVEQLKADPHVRVYINGYTDGVGTVAGNLSRSQSEAQSVAEYLEDSGISTDRLIIHGFGETHFLATNETAEGRAVNRRVELIPIN